MTTNTLPLHRINMHRNYGDAPAPYAVIGEMGTLAYPMFAHVATPAAWIGGYNSPEITTTGVVCGECADAWGALLENGERVRHASAAHVRRCGEIRREIEEDERAEWPLVRAGWL